MNACVVKLIILPQKIYCLSRRRGLYDRKLPMTEVEGRIFAVYAVLATGWTFQRVLLKPGTAGRNSELDCVLKLNHGTHLKLAARYICTCCLPAP